MPVVNDTGPGAGVGSAGVDPPGWKQFPTASPWQVRSLASWEERVPRSACFASRTLAAILILGLAAPVPPGYTHLHLSLLSPPGRSCMSGAFPGDSAPSSSRDPAGALCETRLADQDEPSPEGKIAATRMGPRPAARTARRSCRVPVRGRTGVRRRSRSSRRGRSSIARGDPRSEGPGPDAPSARAFRVDRDGVTHVPLSTPSAPLQPHRIHSERRPIRCLTPVSHTYRGGSPCSGIPRS